MEQNGNKPTSLNRMETEKINHENAQMSSQNYGGNYAERFQYDYQRGRLEIDKNRVLQADRLAFEKQREAMKIDALCQRKMMEFRVFQSDSGELMFAICNGQQKEIHVKKLVAQRNVKAKMLFSASDCTSMVLEVSWAGEGVTSLYFPIEREGILSSLFLKKLNGAGARLLVSGRTERAAAEALLAWCITNAQRKELPARPGWNRMLNGNWHFAHRNEQTMREVLVK